MSINNAIAKVKPIIEKEKSNIRKARQDRKRKEKIQEQRERLRDEKLLALLKTNWQPVAVRLKKDSEIMAGIRFLEQQGEHFTLYSQRPLAVYFCADGSFKMQRWGWYMGSEFIRSIARDNIYLLDKHTILKMPTLDFKRELTKQIEKLASKKFEENDLF